MLREFEKYLGKEYNDAVNIVDSSPWWCSTRTEKLDMVWHTIQRGLGVAQFIQILGISFEECNELYENFRVKIMDLMDEI